MRALTGVIIALGLIATSAPAIGAEHSDAEPGLAVYAVVVTDTSTGPAGEETVRTAEGELRLACEADVCRVIAEPGFGFLGTVPLSPGSVVSGQAATPAAGTPCAGGRGARTVEIEARVDGFTATLDQVPVEWTECPDGTEGYAHARTVGWTGTPLAVDPCIFEDAACVAAVGTASRLASGDPAAPSVLSALIPPSTAQIVPTQLLLAALVTVILVLLMSFPTSLLNRAVDVGSDRLSAWWKRRHEPAGVDGSTRRSWTTTWWWAAAGVLVAAVISSFVDPQFGFNPGSARTMLSIAVGFVVDIMLGWVVVMWLMRRFVPGAVASFSFQPLSLLIVIVGVVFTRVTGFEPGIVFGLVAGVSFGAIVGAAANARSTLVTFGWAFLLAIVGWFCYGLAVPLSGQSVAGTLFVETLASLTIGGIVALPLGLIPLRGMGGHRLWSWNRGVWAACYAVGLFAFFVVLMPMPFSWGEVGWELWTWIGLYLAYAAVAVVAWLVLARPWRRATDDDAAATSEEVPAGRVEE